MTKKYRPSGEKVAAFSPLKASSTKITFSIESRTVIGRASFAREAGGHRHKVVARPTISINLQTARVFI
jgi:hypothetical protein